MALCTIHFESRSLGKQDAMTVLLPEGTGPFPVLYLLHGLSGDHTTWTRRTSIERYAAERDLIIVMPEGDRTFYVNDPRPGGPAWEDHMVEDVIGFVDRTFRTVASRRGRAVAGLSMGGYGAMMLAMRHPKVFSVAAAHSGAFLFVHGPSMEQPGVTELSLAMDPKQYDLWELAQRLSRRKQDLALRFDCGKQDWLIGSNRKFHRHLERLGVSHEYAEHAGVHEWAYWDAHVCDTLDFVGRHLRSK